MEMKALTFRGKKEVRLETVPRPTLLHPTDCVVRVSLCAICGSDLHPYHQRETGIASGTVVGHEFVGTIVEAGAEVKKLKLGDRVMSPFTTNCGGCWYCRRGATCRCCHAQAHLFGWISESETQLPPEARRGLHGSQAQFVRVPLADATLAVVPDGVSDEEGVLLGDILSTAFFCAEGGAIVEGESVVAVVGCGPVGLLAILAARHLGAARVFAVDAVPERLAMAASFGAEALDFSRQDVVAAVKAATDGRGADTVLEVVGASSALRLAFDLLRPMGTLSSVGVHTDLGFPFSPVNGYDKNLSYRSGRCPARHMMDRLVDLVQSRKYDFAAVITHRLPLSAGVEAYRMFDEKADGCVKVVLDPWT